MKIINEEYTEKIQNELKKFDEILVLINSINLITSKYYTILHQFGKNDKDVLYIVKNNQSPIKLTDEMTRSKTILYLEGYLSALQVQLLINKI